MLTNDNIKACVDAYLQKYSGRNSAYLERDGVIHISRWDVKNVTNMSGLFKGKTNFNEDINKWFVNNVTNMESMFEGCENFNRDLYWIVNNVTNMKRMFAGCKRFEGYIGDWNVEKVVNMEEMFLECEVLDSDLSDWNVSSVNTMESMFSNCKRFDVSSLIGWDVSNVTNMSGMFYGCGKFSQYLHMFNRSRDIGYWNVSKVTNMSYMFCECEKLDIDLSRWDVSNVTDMSDMFSDCIIFNNGGNQLKWNVSKCENMENMFEGCTLFKQDLSRWNVTRVTNHDNMFNRCPCPIRYQPPFVNAYQVHKKASKIKYEELIKLLQKNEIPDSFKANPFEDIERMLLAIAENVSLRTDALTSVLDRIRHVNMLPITMLHESVYHSLYYVLTQPPGFQALYLETLVADCTTAHDGADVSETMSCPFGILERCIFSLLAPCHVEENPEYSAIIQAIVPPLAPISDSILKWYKSHKGRKFNMDLTENAHGKLFDNLKTYLHEEGYSNEDIDALDEMDLDFDEDAFGYGGGKTKRKRWLKKKLSQRSNFKKKRKTRRKKKRVSRRF